MYLLQRSALAALGRSLLTGVLAQIHPAWTAIAPAALLAALTFRHRAKTRK
jgi:hypothetical protein